MKTFATEQESDSKLSELMLYIAKKSQDDPHFGAVKLNKILFFADFMSYKRTGKPITGAKYRRLPNGPAPVRALQVINSLCAKSRASIQTRERFDFNQKRPIPLHDPSLDLFTGADIALVDSVIDRFQNSNAKKTSDLSHTLPAWLCAEDDEEIPYETAWVLPPQFEPQDVAKARVFEANKSSAGQTIVNG